MTSILYSFLLAGLLFLTSCSKDPEDELETVIEQIEIASEGSSGTWIVSSHDVIETNSTLRPYRATLLIGWEPGASRQRMSDEEVLAVWLNQYEEMVDSLNKGTAFFVDVMKAQEASKARNPWNQVAASYWATLSWSEGKWYTRSIEPIISEDNIEIWRRFAEEAYQEINKRNGPDEEQVSVENRIESVRSGLDSTYKNRLYALLKKIGVLDQKDSS